MFATPNGHAALARAQEADELITGRLGAVESPAEQWYYAGRDHAFFSEEADIRRGEPSGLALRAQLP